MDGHQTKAIPIFNVVVFIHFPSKKSVSEIVRRPVSPKSSSVFSKSLLQVNEDGFDTHGYLEMVRDTDNPEFRAEVAEFEHKYELPRMKKGEIDSLPTIALEETDTDTDSGEKSDFLSSRIQERKKKRKDGKKK